MEFVESALEQRTLNLLVGKAPLEDEEDERKKFYYHSETPSNNNVNSQKNEENLESVDFQQKL